MRARVASFAVVAAAALAVAAGCSRTPQQTVPVGDLRASIALDPDPPIAGENRLSITLTDAGGAPVDAATIGFTYDMAAMGSMGEMSGGGKTTALGGGRYRVDYTLPMLGDWTLDLPVQAPGHAPADLVLRVSPPHKGFGAETEAPMTETSAGSTAPSMSTGTAGLAAGKPIAVSPARQQLIGVTFARVEPRALSKDLRAPGRVEVDERQLTDVTLKYDAYVETVIAAETGKEVHAGDPLVTVYSPDLVAAEQELLQAEHALAAGTPGAEGMARGARTRLTLWDLTAEQLRAIEASGKADGRLTIHAPASGAILEKDAIAGMHVMPGTSLYRIGNLGRIWVIADLFEQDAPFAEVGQPATIVLPSVLGPPAAGRVTFVAPTVDAATRTLQARIELANASLRLKPGMYADVLVHAPLGTRLAVPDRALLLSGGHRYAFVRRGPGRLQAVEVDVGAETGEWDEVRGGLTAGDEVAVDATFLLSSEAQLRDALPKWSGE